MCLTPDIPKQEPVAPLAPLEPPKPMGLADATQKRKQGGLDQLRISSKADGSGLSGPSA